jgi:hypothetical protein
MKKIWLAALLLGSFGLEAEQLGNIEYRPPSENWELSGKTDNEKGRTHIYLPKTTPNDSHQIFTVHVNNVPTQALSESNIKETLSKFFPDANVQVKVLAKNKDSIIYQWDTPQVHGVTRILSSPTGTSILTYQTEDGEHLQGKFLDHLVYALQDAHFVQDNKR